MQTNKSEGPRPGMLRTLGMSISSDGMRSIYQGLSASLLRQVGACDTRLFRRTNFDLLPLYSSHTPWSESAPMRPLKTVSRMVRRPPSRCLTSWLIDKVLVNRADFLGRKPTTSQLIIAGAVAGGLGGIAGNPADIVLVRMTTDAVRPPELQRGYRHALDGVLRIVQEEGALALTRGWMPNTVSTFSFAVV